MTKQLEKKVKNVSTQKEFDNLVSRVRMSTAPYEVREGVVKEMEKLRPGFAQGVGISEIAKRQIFENTPDVSDIAVDYAS